MNLPSYAHAGMPMPSQSSNKELGAGMHEAIDAEHTAVQACDCITKEQLISMIGFIIVLRLSALPEACMPVMKIPLLESKRIMARGCQRPSCLYDASCVNEPDLARAQHRAATESSWRW